MFENGQTQFDNLAANTEKFLMYGCPLLDVMHKRVKTFGGRWGR